MDNNTYWKIQEPELFIKPENNINRKFNLSKSKVYQENIRLAKEVLAELTKLDIKNENDNNVLLEKNIINLYSKCKKNNPNSKLSYKEFKEKITNNKKF